MNYLLKRTCVAITAALSSQLALSADNYDQNKNYQGSEQACLNGNLFEAKWWANPGQSPADVFTAINAWDTPWALIESNSNSCPDSENSPIPSEPEEEPDNDDTNNEDTTPEQPPSNTSPCESSTWEASTIYNENDIVKWNSINWRAGWWTNNDEPGTTGQWGVWREATEEDCSNHPEQGNNPAEDNNPNDNEPNDNNGPGENNDENSGNNGNTGPDISRQALQERETELTSGELMSLVRASIATRDNAIIEAITPLSPNNPENVRRVESIISEADWNYLFPRRASEYTYRKYLQAVGKFPAFCGDYDDGRDAEAICRKSLATMFAHFTQETGGHTNAWVEPQWRQGLHYIRELGWSEEMPNGYGLCDPNTWQGATWPCAVYPEGHPNAGQYKSYFGRGAKQLSYNYNYGPFSFAMYGSVDVLLENPELVADTWLNLASAIFFYVYPQPPKPSMLHVMDGTWQPNASDVSAGLVHGFGVTTQIINGGIECGGSSEHIQSQNRIDYYLNFAAYLHVPVAGDEVLGCASMQQFDSQGAAALPIYWEQDWSSTNACQLVSYQTPFSAFTDGDYIKCVEHYYDVNIVD